MTDVGGLEFHHVHFYVNEVKPLDYYKALEAKFNKFAAAYDKSGSDMSEEKGRGLWQELFNEKIDPSAYVSQGQDLICQAISGLGWRVTGYCVDETTTTALVTSHDPNGVRFVITGPNSKEPAVKKRKTETKYAHFGIDEWQTFKDSHIDREGVSVLAFKTKDGTLQEIAGRYKKMHPKLFKSVNSYKNGDDEFSILEVYAYYLPNSTDEDKGTTIRFVEHGPAWDAATLPGIDSTKADFAKGWDSPAYSDHWVSNVQDRVGFMKTLEDTLGMVPKVDFNAGVVAAGEAIIESTVVGNTPSKVMKDEGEALISQHQIFLPTNNPMSTVGHVHGFIAEIGQGIQHLASRVKDLGAFIERVNKVRDMTGEGFKFLRIPRSYYGRLGAANLTAVGLSTDAANTVLSTLQKAGLVTPAGIVDFQITDAQITSALSGVDTKGKISDVCAVVKQGRYNNMYKLLRDNVSEPNYLRLVQNQILVDIQGDDMLYQIFTANILQNKPADESPFLEFIQRVCSEKKDKCGNPAPMRPGCGGFGIRNFLTLFLSIEVSKAMVDLETASEQKDEEGMALAQKMVDMFTEQLDESNPILTMISDAMTAEADTAAELKYCTDAAEKKRLEALVEKHRATKENGNVMLGACSDKYKAIMKGLRAQKK